MTWELLLPLDVLFCLPEDELLPVDLFLLLPPPELLLFLVSVFTSTFNLSYDKLLSLVPLLWLPLVEELSLLLAKRNKNREAVSQ